MVVHDAHMSHETIDLERRGGAALIRLNRPEALNAFDARMSSELLEAVRELADDDAVRAVCITGAGRAFSAGADLRDFANVRTTAEGHADLGGALVEVYNPLLSTVRHMPKPVVAAVNGGAAGIGCSLALACDLVVAHETAYLLLAFARVGLAPDGGASALVSARVGAARAAEMAMLGERVSAETALQWGLINRVAGAHDFEATVDGLVDGLAAGPTRSYAASKRQLNAWLYRDWDAQLALEAELQQEMAGTRDFAEGVTAFAGKRAPEFIGA
jgi:2-(1,2-epoxy-1,2-dihydrophenyl)acetyl-CoA isomerase